MTRFLKLHGDKISCCVILGLMVLVLASCGDITPEEEQQMVAQRSRLVGVVDGCNIWEVYNRHGTNPFFARCPEGVAMTTWETGSKTKTKQFTLGD